MVRPLLAFSGARALLAPKNGARARIYKDGELFCTIDLSSVAEPYTVQVGGGNVVRVERGRIRMESADCPDKLCVGQGWSSSAAKPIVCLPNRVTIIVEGGSGVEPDAVSR
jgi:hypothetical protein